MRFAPWSFSTCEFSRITHFRRLGFYNLLALRFIQICPCECTQSSKTFFSWQYPIAGLLLY